MGALLAACGGEVDPASPGGDLASRPPADIDGAAADADAAAACVVAGVSYAEGAVNPADACGVCRAAASSSAFSTASDGVDCGAGRYCIGGACVAYCTVDGDRHPDGALDPNDACRGCQPTFDDLVTGKRFQFLHLRPQHQNTTVKGKVYPAGTIVGLTAAIPGIPAAPAEAIPPAPTSACRPATPGRTRSPPAPSPATEAASSARRGGRARRARW